MSRRPWKRASPADVGRLAHRAIADMLSTLHDPRQGSPGWREVLDVVDARLVRDGYRDLAARQLIAAAALNYLRVLPGDPWEFVRAEMPLPGGRLDLVWRHRSTGELLVDEVKTGQAGAAPRSVRDQVDRYARLLTAEGWSATVRVVATRQPEVHPMQAREGCEAPHALSGRGSRPPPRAG